VLNRRKTAFCLLNRILFLQISHRRILYRSKCSFLSQLLCDELMNETHETCGCVVLEVGRTH